MSERDKFLIDNFNPSDNGLLAERLMMISYYEGKRDSNNEALELINMPAKEHEWYIRRANESLEGFINLYKDLNSKIEKP